MLEFGSQRIHMTGTGISYEIPAVANTQVGEDICPVNENISCDLAPDQNSPTDFILTLTATGPVDIEGICNSLSQVALDKGNAFDPNTCTGYFQGLNPVSGGTSSFYIPVPADGVINYRDGFSASSMNALIGAIETQTQVAAPDNNASSGKAPAIEGYLLGAGAAIFGAVMIYAGVRSVVDKVKAKRERSVEEHPHTGLSRNSQTGEYHRPYEYHHSGREIGRETDEQKQTRSRLGTVRMLLDEHDVLKRAPDYSTWPVSREHEKDTQAAIALTDAITGMDETERNSFFFFIQKDQKQKFEKSYKEAFWFDKKASLNGSSFNMDLDHPFYLQGAKGINKLLTDFKKSRQ